MKYKIRISDSSDVRREFLKAIGKGYSIRVLTSQETFDTRPDLPSEILVSAKAMRTRLTFPLDPFLASCFNTFGLTPIQLTPNSWAYLLSFTKYARKILRKKPGVALFKSIFTVAAKGDSNLTYAFFIANTEVKVKFKGFLSKVWD